MFMLFSSTAIGADDRVTPLREITPGVWFREGIPNSRHPARVEEMGTPNATIIEMKDYLIVVDANFPVGARLIMEAIRKVSSKPVKYVFDTHHHADHSSGNAVWHKAGATTLAYVGVAEELKRMKPPAPELSALQRKMADMHVPSAEGPIEPPMQSFDASPFVLDDGSRRVEFHFLGWAHTRGDGFVFLPKEKILCTGDALANGGYNYLGDGYVENWNNVLRKAKTFGAKYVIPGHGPLAGPDVFDGQMLFFTELEKAVRAAIARGQKLDALVFKDPDPHGGMFGLGGGMATAIVLPDTVKHWISVDRLPLQVTATYNEITMGKPSGEIQNGK
jgi:glyoxylase-like metal-dependent hydrolase (beta-lactamase superfamily II)